MDRNATSADAELILKLYDLRREAQMRKARDWYAGTFWPQTFDDVMKPFTDFGSAESAYFRQVVSYWEMASSLVHRGALNADLFLDNSGEMIFVYLKLKPFLSQLRQTMNAPEFMAKVEALLESSPEAKARMERLQKNFDNWKKMREQKQQTAGR
jgi:L-rhamnose mutarotase